MNEAEQLLAAALALPHGERAALADALVRSLDEASSHVDAMDPAIEAAWAEFDAESRTSNLVGP